MYREDNQFVAKKIIKNICAVKGISIHKLAEITGVRQSTLNEIMQGRSKSPRLETFQKLANGLDMTVAELFDRYG